MQSLFNLIEYTSRNVFVTGRAGTGKTTFLQNFVKRTSKKYAIAAPTGIAAINAGGVTLHSLFGLPLSTFAPVTTFVDRNLAINIPNLLPHFKYRRDKLKLLRTLEILIIDEVSMLRCDVLDMLDLALRTARKNQQLFGGVQMLFIGDLYQLPPVVKTETEQILYTYYNSPFFFNAKALQDLKLLTVTLHKVYRQSDPVFLKMLNAIRDNDIDNIDFELLHSRYQPHFEPEEFYVHLVSHNYMADQMNKKQLNDLPGKSHIYKASVWGDFKPHLFPNEEELELKKGAQVMFIRNDSEEEKRFYNGRLATIAEMDEEEIKVLPQGETEVLTIRRETWENKKYFVDENNKIAEEVVGRYEQFPFKLAWAVTIHKSQGLTFDKVIVDAGRSFTSGQVYVALSRCRTLEGIVLKSRISPQAIITDERILSFQKETDASDKIEAIVQSEQYHYAGDQLLRRLNMQHLLSEAMEWKSATAESAVLDSEETMKDADTVLNALKNLGAVYDKFTSYLHNQLRLFTQSYKGWEQIEEKSRGAVHFFFREANNKVFNIIKERYSETKGTKGLKGYNEVLKNFIDVTASYLSLLKQARLLDVRLYTENNNDVIRTEVTKKPTHIITCQLFEEGKTPQEIAAQRGITEGTVLGHLAKIAETGTLDLQRIFPAEHIQLFEDRFRKHHFKSLTEWKNALPDFFGYNEIRILLNHFRYHAGK